MSKNDQPEVPEMRDEYEFADGIRGKYAERLKQGCRVVVLEPDVAAAFPDEDAVNRALRVVMARRKSEEGAA